MYMISKQVTIICSIHITHLYVTTTPSEAWTFDLSNVSTNVPVLE